MSLAVGLWTAANTSQASGFAGFAVACAVLDFGEGACTPWSVPHAGFDLRTVNIAE